MDNELLILLERNMSVEQLLATITSREFYRYTYEAYRFRRYRRDMRIQGDDVNKESFNKQFFTSYKVISDSKDLVYSKAETIIREVGKIEVERKL